MNRINLFCNLDMILIDSVYSPPLTLFLNPRLVRSRTLKLNQGDLAIIRLAAPSTIVHVI